MKTNLHKLHISPPVLPIGYLLSVLLLLLVLPLMPLMAGPSPAVKEYQAAMETGGAPSVANVLQENVYQTLSANDPKAASQIFVDAVKGLKVKKNDESKIRLRQVGEALLEVGEERLVAELMLVMSESKERYVSHLFNEPMLQHAASLTQNSDPFVRGLAALALYGSVVLDNDGGREVWPGSDPKPAWFLT